jgi:hypothetical protein
VRFAILDSHGAVLLEWDSREVAELAFPRKRLDKRARRRLLAALEQLKKELHAL